MASRADPRTEPRPQTGGKVDSAVAELEEKLAASKAIRRPREPQWFVNLAYHAGEQWVGFDGVQLFEPQLEDWRAKCVDNRIRPAVRAELARMTKAQPVWTGVPKDLGDKEVAAARMRERVFQHFWRSGDLVHLLRAALLWRVASAGFWKVSWDSTAGPRMDVLVGPDGKTWKDDNGKPFPVDVRETLPPEIAEQLKPAQVGMGDARFELRTPFEIYPDDLAGEEGLEGAAWIIEDAVHRPADIAEQFGVELEPDAQANAGISESRMPWGVQLGLTDGRKTGVRIREFWAKPCSEYKDGKWCVWANNKLLHEDVNPYPWLPYVMFAGAPVPGRFWPDGTVDDLVPQQTSLNKRESQIEENAERIGNPPLVRSASTEDVEWHGLPGEELVFQDTGTPNSVPQFLNVPELGVYVREDVDRRIDSIRELSGHSEIQAGSVPSGVTAAAAINLLLESNNDILAPDVGDMNKAISGAGRRLLWMLRKYASDERLAKIPGEEGAWDVFAFRGDDLGDCDEDGVEVASGVPQSKAAKQAAIQEVLNMFAQAGVQLNERDLRRVLQQYEIGGLEQFFASIGQDERQVARENQRLVRGEPLPINSYDDDDVHIASHQDLQKTARYDELPDQVKQAVEAHVQEHVKRRSDMELQQQKDELDHAKALAEAEQPPVPPASQTST